MCKGNACAFHERVETALATIDDVYPEGVHKTMDNLADIRARSRPEDFDHHSNGNAIGELAVFQTDRIDSLLM